MDLNKAYSILGVNSSISDEDLKRAYRDLAKTFHPDVNKSEPDKFKLINEAYQLIQNHRSNPQKHNSPFGAQNINIDLSEMFMHDFFGASKQRQVYSINIKTNISFKESVIGCDKQISYTRMSKCTSCGGAGHKRIPNGCKSCDGFGKSVSKNGNMVFSRTCSKCFGKNVKNEDCQPCNGDGTTREETNGSISIPPGRLTGDTLCLRGKGNFAGETVFGEQYTDVMIQIIVEKDNHLELIGNDVVENIHITLLEALTGCEKEVHTINGVQNIQVPKISSNKDEIHLKGLGVKNSNGKQRVILNIDYPDDNKIAQIIEALKN